MRRRSRTACISISQRMQTTAMQRSLACSRWAPARSTSAKPGSSPGGSSRTRRATSSVLYVRRPRRSSDSCHSLHHWATDDAAVRRALRQPSGEVTLDLRQLNLSLRGVEAMEFLVEFDIGIPKGTSEIEVAEREQAEAVAAAALVAQGHLL